LAVSYTWSQNEPRVFPMFFFYYLEIDATQLKKSESLHDFWEILVILIGM
jgi:hypothetical protein